VIKRLSANCGEDEWLHDKFRDEAAALTRIDHAGVVGVLDAGEASDGTPFLVLPYITGADAPHRESQSGSLPPERGAAHSSADLPGAGGGLTDCGVLHRDLKPENIVLRPAGPGEDYPVLIDFGLATFTNAQRSSQVTRVVGTLSYMAPEQFAGQVSARSDLYSVGVIAREILGGEIPEPARTVLAKATAYDEGDRYANIRDFSEDLTRALSGRPSRRRQRRFVIGVAAGLALAILILAAAFRYREAAGHVTPFTASSPLEVASAEETHVTERKGNANIPQSSADPDLSGAIGWRAYPMVRLISRSSGESGCWPAHAQMECERRFWARRPNSYRFDPYP